MLGRLPIVGQIGPDTEQRKHDDGRRDWPGQTCSLAASPEVGPSYAKSAALGSNSQEDHSLLNISTDNIVGMYLTISCQHSPSSKLTKTESVFVPK